MACHLTNVASPGVVLRSNVSGNRGCGAYSGPHWFMLPWTGSIADYHITLKELIPIVIVGAIWGSTWRGSTVLAQYDNTTVVHIVNHSSSKNPDTMHLSRCLAFITAKFDFHVVMSHIKRAHPAITSPCSARYTHRPSKEPVPQSLLDLLISVQASPGHPSVGPRCGQLL